MIRLKHTSLLVCLLAILVFGACNNKCEDFDEMPNFDQLENIDGVEEINLDCIDYVDLPTTNVIQTQAEYESLLGPLMGMVSNCQPDTLTEIDFTQRTLLWGITYQSDVQKAIWRNGNIVTYTFKVRSDIFAAGRFRMNAISIPKTSNLDTIVFEFGQHGCK